MIRNDTGLAPRQRRGAEMLASGISAKQVAESLGITPLTVYRWQQNETFRSQVERALCDAETEATALLRGLRLQAIERLGTLVSSTNENIALRTAAEILNRQKLTVPIAENGQEGCGQVDMGAVLKALGIIHG